MLRNEAFANDGKPDDIKVFSQDELWKFRHNRDYTPSEVEAMGHLSPEQKQALLDSPAIYYGSTDYMKRIFDAGVSPQQQYSVNISGGTEKVAFFTSVGYSNQKSLTNDFGFSDAASNSAATNIISAPTSISTSSRSPRSMFRSRGRCARRRSSPTATAAWTCGAVTAT